MTTPTEEDSLRSVLQQTLAAAERSAPPVEPSAIRGRVRPRGRRFPRLDVTITVAVAAAVIAAVVLIIVGPGRSSGHHGGLGPATRPPSQHPVSSTVPSTVPNSVPTTTTPSVTTPPSTTTTTPPGTQIINYDPFTASGAIDPGITITGHVSGTCMNGEANGRYRCIGDQNSGSGIFDPCFAGPGGTAGVLVCPGDPTSSTAVEFTGTWVGSDIPPPVSQPWALQLSDGTVCQFVSAAWGGLGPYDCQSYDPSATVADCHTPQSGRPSWTVDCQADKSDASPFTSYTVKVLWY